MSGNHSRFPKESAIATTTVGIPAQSQVDRLRMRRRKWKPCRSLASSGAVSGVPGSRETAAPSGPVGAGRRSGVSCSAAIGGRTLIARRKAAVENARDLAGTVDRDSAQLELADPRQAIRLEPADRAVNGNARRGRETEADDRNL